MTTDADEAMDSLIGHGIEDWGKDESMYHITLDDGRVLVFIGLGIVMVGDHALH